MEGIYVLKATTTEQGVQLLTGFVMWYHARSDTDAYYSSVAFEACTWTHVHGFAKDKGLTEPVVRFVPNTTNTGD